MTINCACQNVHPGRKEIEEFKSLWEQCPALKRIFIPKWPDWEAALAALENDSSGHRSILMLAFERGYLSRLTCPVHKFLMEGDAPSAKLHPQYVQDLQELWFMRPEASRRHKRSKSYLGRLAELLVVEWAGKTRRIIALEATGGNHDILTLMQDDVPEAMEVKFIGTQDSDFENLMKMRIFGGAVDLETAADFLLTRIYEAAKQLGNFQDRRTVIVVIDEQMAWPKFEAALKYRLDLTSPKLTSTSPDWVTFLDGLKKDYPEIVRDLAATVLSLKEIRIFSLISDETLREELVFHPSL